MQSLDFFKVTKHSGMVGCIVRGQKISKFVKMFGVNLMKEAQRFSLQRLLNKSLCKDGSEKGKGRNCVFPHSPSSFSSNTGLFEELLAPILFFHLPQWNIGALVAFLEENLHLCVDQPPPTTVHDKHLAEIPRPVWLYFSALSSGWKSSGSWRRAGAGDPRRVRTPQPGPASVQLEKNVFLPLPLSQTEDCVEAASQKASSSFRCRQEVAGHLQNKSRIELRLNGAKRQQSLMENRLIFVVSMLNM